MNKTQLMKLIENLNDEDSINELLLGTDVEESIKARALTLDNFKTLTNSNKDFISYLDSLKDTHVNSVLKTMKEKGTWEKEFQDVLEEKYPDLFKVEDPVIKALKDEVEQMKREKAETDREIAKNKANEAAIQYFNETYKDLNGIPSEILKQFVSVDNEDLTKQQLDFFANAYKDSILKDRETYLKSQNYPPGAGKGSDSNNNTDTKISLEDAMKIANENPNVDIDSLMSRVGK